MKTIYFPSNTSIFFLDEKNAVEITSNIASVCIFHLNYIASKTFNNPTGQDRSSWIIAHAGQAGECLAKIPFELCKADQNELKDDLDQLQKENPSYAFNLILQPDLTLHPREVPPPDLVSSLLSQVTGLELFLEYLPTNAAELATEATDHIRKLLEELNILQRKNGKPLRWLQL